MMVTPCCDADGAIRLSVFTMLWVGSARAGTEPCLPVGFVRDGGNNGNVVRRSGQTTFNLVQDKQNRALELRVVRQSEALVVRQCAIRPFRVLRRSQRKG